MKVYSSDLLEITQVPTGHILEIADAHTTAGVDTSSVEGLVIAGGDVDRYITGTGQEKSITNESIGRLPVAVLSTDGTAGAVANSGTTTTGGAFIDSSILQDTSGHVIIRSGASTDANLTVTGNAIVEGDLTVLGANTITNSTTVATEDPYIAVNNSVNDTTGAITAPTTPNGGLLVAKVTETAAQASGAVSAGTGGTHAGIRYNEDTVANGGGQWEVSVGVPAAGGVDANWTAIPLSSSGAQGYNVTVASGLTIGLLGVSTHGLSGTDFIIKVYETATNTYTEVIPEDIIVARVAASIEGATRAVGDILIKFPADSGGDRTFRVVVI